MNDIHLPNKQLFVNASPSLDGIHSKELALSAKDPPIRVRKPYTISKQREKWTEEEHEKFLEAIKFHGRAWRQIQEHIGTKTVIQIRSHSQKFFSKVYCESDTRKYIEIPPPRPKRKPMHPYPHKLVHACTAGIPNVKLQEKSSPTISFSDQESGSPVSFLSLVSSRALKPQNICALPLSSMAGSDSTETSHSDSENGCYSPSSSTVHHHQILPLDLETNSSTNLDKTSLGVDLYRKNYIYPEKVLSEQSQPTSLKLFGRTFSITNYKNAAERFEVVPTAIVSTEEKTGTDMEVQTKSFVQFFPCKSSCNGVAPSVCSQIMRSNIAAMHVQPKGEVQMNSKAEVIAPLPIWSSFEGSLSLTFTKQQNMMLKQDLPLKRKETPTILQGCPKIIMDDGKQSVEGQEGSGFQEVPRCTSYSLERSKNSAFSRVKARKTNHSTNRFSGLR
ncbi:protein REVEILLE 2-like [Curcuma longa]|uniref:protein REVEILLE 2-like n=1 Tax=Curcuma longa TaxID=136217 RepID=UPI003D9EA4A7